MDSQTKAYHARLRERARSPLRYLKTLPAVVPVGLVVCHNVLPGHPRRRPTGRHGFRAWLARPDDHPMVVCGCGWAPELSQHFRVNRDRVSVQRIRNRNPIRGTGS